MNQWTSEIFPADVIDAVDGETLRRVLSHDVDVLTYRAQISPPEIVLADNIPVGCPELK